MRRYKYGSLYSIFHIQMIQKKVEALKAKGGALEFLCCFVSNRVFAKRTSSEALRYMYKVCNAMQPKTLKHPV